MLRDCETLLAAKDALQGTATLDWSTSTAIGSWEGIATGGTPSRVTELDLASESLTGSIPARLGHLFKLTTLDLSSNQLTGDIPPELVWLTNLTELRLSGNSLTGCIPVALRSVATNDLSSLNLLYCEPPAPTNLHAGTPGERSVVLNWDAVTNASTYRVEYRTGDPEAWSTDSDTITGMTHTVDELQCETTYELRVSAYGSGTSYAAVLGRAVGGVHDGHRRLHAADRGRRELRVHVERAGCPWHGRGHGDGHGRRRQRRDVCDHRRQRRRGVRDR